MYLMRALSEMPSFVMRSHMIISDPETDFAPIGEATIVQLFPILFDYWWMHKVNDVFETLAVQASVVNVKGVSAEIKLQAQLRIEDTAMTVNVQSFGFQKLFLCSQGQMNVYGNNADKIELTLEQSQQVVSNDVLVSIEGVEDMKKKLWLKGL
ncbi:hypothetical protein Tco_1174374 [Tanacetum coccineum]